MTLNVLHVSPPYAVFNNLYSYICMNVHQFISIDVNINVET